jgi:hypothetical protein
MIEEEKLKRRNAEIEAEKQAKINKLLQNKVIELQMTLEANKARDQAQTVKQALTKSMAD